MTSSEKILVGLLAASVFVALYAMVYYAGACRRPEEETMGREISFALYWSIGAIIGSAGLIYWFAWYICLAVFALWYLLSWPLRFVLRILFSR